MAAEIEATYAEEIQRAQDEVGIDFYRNLLGIFYG